MNCSICGKPETTYKFALKKRVEVKAGDGVKGICCSRCIQRILGGGGKAFQLRREVTRTGAKKQRDELVKLLYGEAI